MRTRSLLLMLAFAAVTPACMIMPHPVPVNPNAMFAPVEVETQKRLFGPLDDKWIMVVQTVKVTDDGQSFVLLRGSKQPPGTITFYPAPFWKPTTWGEYSIEEFYRTPEEQKVHQIYRSRWFDPSGRLFDECVQEGPDWYSRGFYEDGSLREYKHYGRGLETGYAVNPNGKEIAEVRAGKGTWVEWGREGQRREHLLAEGHAYLERDSKNGIPWRVTLILGDDRLIHTDKEEKLRLSSEYEIWTKAVGKPIFAQVMDEYIEDGQLKRFRFKDDAVKGRIRQVFGTMGVRGGSFFGPRSDEKLLQELDIDYLERREAFLERFDERLRELGQTWEALGLAGLRPKARPASSHGATRLEEPK